MTHRGSKEKERISNNWKLNLRGDCVAVLPEEEHFSTKCFRLVDQITCSHIPSIEPVLPTS